MILAFLLVVTVAGEKVSDDSMLFKNIYRCNAFAIAIENGRESPNDENPETILPWTGAPKNFSRGHFEKIPPVSSSWGNHSA